MNGTSFTSHSLKMKNMNCIEIKLYCIYQEGSFFIGAALFESMTFIRADINVNFNQFQKC